MRKQQYPLTGFGLKAQKHLKEYRPRMYRQLEEAGILRQYLHGVQEQAKTAMLELMDGGRTYSEAMEIVGKEYLYLPSEQEMPNLGEMAAAETSPRPRPAAAAVAPVTTAKVQRQTPASPPAAAQIMNLLLEKQKTPPPTKP